MVFTVGLGRTTSVSVLLDQQDSSAHQLLVWGTL